MVANDDDTHDWMADCDGEGKEQAVRDGRDSRVVMMAVAAEDGSSRQQRQRRTTTAVDNSSMQDWVANYKGEGQEQAARDGGVTGWTMTAATAEDGGGGQGRRQMRTTATADNDSSRRQRQQTTAACKIGRRTPRGKEESGRQTTTALDKRLSPLGRECEKIKKSSLCKKTFFSNMVCPIGFFAPAKTANVPF